MRKLPLKTKAEQLARMIEEMIQAGEWTETLPGMEVLAKKYSVNPKTVQRALRLVEQNGWLLPSERRKARKINPSRRQVKAGNRKSLLMLYSGIDAKDLVVGTVLQQMSDRWMRHGTAVNMEQVDFAYHKEPSKYLRRLVERHSADAILFYNASRRWIEVGMNMLPVFCCGGGITDSMKITSMGFRFSSQIAWLIQKLNSMGHERIMFSYTDPDRGIREEVLSVDAFPGKQENLRGRRSDYCVRVAEDLPDVWSGMWEREFTRLQPTAVIVMEGHHLLSLYAFCAKRGIRIPQDLSVVSLVEFEGGNWLEPAITYAQFPYAKMLNYFEKWIRSGLKPLGYREVSMKWMETGSLGAAPRQRS
ncbi:DNA-binding transcriptional regulator, LacI/PurR family [Rubritalea squalenifaciens DSM 18772]|uniref:DNA-binding transcriptional regulator, LacI/PurR family n=1 Tax=Rubritalea squalenifaciens DSM 18772 TaxID=1123071 RepID=A0A1M6QGC9_9BACT|nr:substrate-binding domain-containing protein [Rubritalea squalenifaciens]SHK19292.1 DNA-binding transcriptional regulator, LacI/PurR family [Rubritalea squalenifaciens DSM 18772]